MTKTEILIEAVTYASESDIKWWEVFETLEEAKKVLFKAAKETPDDNQIVCMLSVFEDSEFEYSTPEEVYQNIIKKLKKELREARENDEDTKYSN